MEIREREISQPEIRERQITDKSSDEYNLPNYPYAFRPPTPQEDLKTRKNIKEGTLGAIQNFANTPEEYANIINKHLYNKFNFAPNTEASKSGEIIGDAASYLLPSLFTGGTVGLLSSIPRVNRLVNAGREALHSRPIANFLTNLAKNGGEAALFQKAKSPESNLTDVSKAGAMGSMFSALAQATTSTNPLVKSLSKLLMGSILGYQVGGKAGVPAGISAAFLGPRMLREGGYTRQPVSHEVLTQPPNNNARAAYEAGQRIGDVPTPAEAFNHPIMGARQGEIGRTEQGAATMTEHGRNRILQQQNAINNLLDIIYPRSTHHQNFISNLYNRSYRHNLSENIMNQLSEDPVFGEGARTVNNEPVYQKDLANVRAHNFAYLDQVKRALNDMEQGSLGEFAKTTNKSRIYGNTSRELTDIMDEKAPIYKVARHHANMDIVRKQIELRLGKKPITGANFYREFLSNENKFNSLINDLRGNPEAQETLKDMRSAWNNLIDYDTAKSSAAMSQRHTNTAREGFQKFWNNYKETLGSPRDIERANFIHDPNWWDHFDEAMQHTNRLQREERIANLIARGISGATLEYSKETKNKKD